MRICAARIFRYRLSLRHAVRLFNAHATTREGFVIKLESDTGGCAYGEVAPVTSTHLETMSDVEQRLTDISLSLTHHSLPDAPTEIEQIITQTPELRAAPRCVEFGVACALVELSAQHHKWTFADSIAASQPRRIDNMADSIRINALLSTSDEDCVDTAIALARSGYTAIKVKVATGRPIEVETALIGEIRKALPPDNILRLDANQGWTLDEAVDFAERASAANVQYIEEPTADLDGLFALLRQRRFPLAVALDESLADLGPNELKDPSGIAALVLKPTVLGMHRTLLLSRWASELRIPACISGCYETSLGASYLAELAAAVDGGTDVSGLTTHLAFRDTLLKEPLAVDAGQIHLTGMSRKRANICWEQLTEVSHA